MAAIQFPFNLLRKPITDKIEEQLRTWGVPPGQLWEHLLSVSVGEVLQGFVNRKLVEIKHGDAADLSCITPELAAKIGAVYEQHYASDMAKLDEALQGILEATPFSNAQNMENALTTELTRIGASVAVNTLQRTSTKWRVNRAAQPPNQSM